MRMKITLFLLVQVFCLHQIYAQCDGADFEERNGIAILELDSKVAGSWQKESVSGASGSSALTYRGTDYFNSPGNSTITYKVKINSSGTYRFIWRSKISIIATDAAPNTEHNDSWLKINGSNFYGKKGSSTVYPGGSGKSPVAKGSTSGGWFKIYTSQIAWSWVTNTSDNDAHGIYATFNSPGVYTIQVSGRSKGHTIDRMALYKEGSYSSSQAEDLSRSVTSCSGSTPTPPPSPTPTPTPPSTNLDPSVSFTNLTNGQSVTPGSNVSINLRAIDSDGSIIKHQIFVNNVLVDTDGSGYTPHIITGIPTGNYEIKATVTDNDGKSNSAVVNIVVGVQTTPPPSGNVAPTVQFISLTEGQLIPLGQVVFVALTANDSDGTVTKYQVYVNGTLVDTDGVSYTSHPFQQTKQGNYLIRVVVTDNKGATGAVEVNVVVGTGSTPTNPTPPTTQTITFNLINAISNVDKGDLTDGATLSASNTQGVNIRANVPSEAKSVLFALSGSKTVATTENFGPYALFGDILGNYNAENLPTGSYQLTAAAYTASNGTGSLIANKSINFTVSSVSGKTAIAFPNPVLTDGKVSIRLPEGTSGQFYYSVANGLGVQVEQGNFNAKASESDIDLELSNIARHAPGIYYLTLISRNSEQTIPLIRK